MSNFFAGCVIGLVVGGWTVWITHAVQKRKSPSVVNMRAQILELKGLNATAGQTIDDLRKWLDTAFGICDLPTVAKTGGHDIDDDIEDMWRE